MTDYRRLMTDRTLKVSSAIIGGAGITYGYTEPATCVVAQPAYPQWFIAVTKDTADSLYKMIDMEITADESTGAVQVRPSSAKQIATSYCNEANCCDDPQWIYDFWNHGSASGATLATVPTTNGWGIAGLTVLYTPPADLQCGLYRY